MTLMPESALARRFRGFINPLPIAQNLIRGVAQAASRCAEFEPPMIRRLKRRRPNCRRSAGSRLRAHRHNRQTRPDRAEARAAMELASAESKTRDAGAPLASAAGDLRGRQCGPAVVSIAGLRERDAACPDGPEPAASRSISSCSRCAEHLALPPRCALLSGHEAGARRTIAIAINPVVGAVVSGRARRKPNGVQQTGSAAAPAPPTSATASVTAPGTAFNGHAWWQAAAQCGGIYFKLGTVYSDAAIRAKVIKPDPAAYARLPRRPTAPARPPPRSSMRRSTFWSPTASSHATRR